MFDRLAGWAGIAGRRVGPRWSGCSPASRAVPGGRSMSRSATAATARPGHASAGAISRRSPRRRHEAPDVQRPGSSVPYAELHAHSAYSFLDGASTPEELVEEAARLDLRAIALTDHDGLYGVVRFAEAAKELDVQTVFGAELSLGGGDRTEEPDPRGPHLLVLARGPEGYRRLSRQLASAHLAGGEKGVLRYDFDALTEAAGGHWHILTGCRKGHVRQALSDGGPEAAEKALADLVDRFGRDRVSIELTHHGHPLDDERNAALAELAPRFGLDCRRRGGSVSASSPPPPPISPSRQGAGWRWPWGRSGRGTRWTRRPVILRRWVARIFGRGRRWRGCSPGCPRW